MGAGAGGEIQRSHSDSAAPSLLMIPTQEAVDKFHEQQKELDNIRYQRENHLEACKELGIPNPDVPRIPGMRPSIKLMGWQPVAVNAIKDFRVKRGLRGALLSDAVGLGKTI